MTVKQMNRLAADTKLYEQSLQLCGRLDRMIRQTEELCARGADPEWVAERMQALQKDLASAKRTVASVRAKREQLRRIIGGAPNEILRMILSLRYERNCSWAGVAVRLGGGNTPDGVRKQAARYLATVAPICNSHK